MVRKLTNSALAFILLLATSGVTYHYHFCCNTLMSFSIFHTPKPCCEHPDHCCSDKAVTLQFRSDYVSSIDHPEISDTGIEVSLVFCCFESYLPSDIDRQVFPEESPPPTVRMRLAKLHQLRI